MTANVRPVVRLREADLPDDVEARERFRSACHRIGLTAVVDVALACRCDESSVRRWLRGPYTLPARALLAAERIADERTRKRAA